MYVVSVMGVSTVLLLCKLLFVKVIAVVYIAFVEVSNSDNDACCVNVGSIALGGATSAWPGTSQV